MSFNFPSSPSLNDTHAIPSGRVYTWDGTAWTLTDEKSSAPVHYVFTTPGAFPLRIPRAVTLIHVQMWGGGAGGNGYYGGGGGGYMEGFLSREDVNFSPLNSADFGTWGYVVVGAGGAGNSSINGNPGGDSWVGPSDSDPATAWLRATGATASSDSAPGYGGGPWIGSTVDDSFLRRAASTPASWWGGRAADSINGQPSVFGGGGGGSDDGFPNTRGASLYGGRGGDVTIGVNGAAPGGGGGFNGSGASGSGGRGEVRVTVFL